MAKKEKNLMELSQVDLEKRLSDLREKVRTDKFKMEGAKSKNVKELKEARREIARVLTAINTSINK